MRFHFKINKYFKLKLQLVLFNTSGCWLIGDISLTHVKNPFAKNNCHKNSKALKGIHNFKCKPELILINEGYSNANDPVKS